MKNFLVVLVFALIGTAVNAQSVSSPVGRWKTVDDETGETKSIIEIYEQDGKFTGKIAEILTDQKDALCTKCKGDQKNKPFLGLVIIKGLVPEDDYWGGGSILDPQKGTEYRLSVWYEGNNANQLFVRGKHWTGLFRTQTWKRVE